MSQTDKLLNSLSDDDIALYTANPEIEPHIIVGEDRFVVVPEELKRIAVQHDNNIETVTFDCPRYWDNHDMSKMAIYINYLPADGEVGSCIATNVHVDESNSDIMHFDWTISGNATVNEGRLIFLVDVKGADGEHWHSELNEDMYVSEGLEPPPIVEIANPDVLTQVLLFNASVTELNKTTLQRAAVYVGPGDMPDGYNVQIDPDGEDVFEKTVEDATMKYLGDYAPSIYVGSGDMPDGYNIQIDPNGDEVTEGGTSSGGSSSSGGTVDETTIERIVEEKIDEAIESGEIGSSNIIAEIQDGSLVITQTGGSGSGDTGDNESISYDTEVWSFTLSDGTVITKKMVVSE